MAFDPDTKRMATLHGKDGAFLAAVKGAPETVLERCTSVRTADGARPLEAAERTAWSFVPLVVGQLTLLRRSGRSS